MYSLHYSSITKGTGKLTYDLFSEAWKKFLEVSIEDTYDICISYGYDTDWNEVIVKKEIGKPIMCNDKYVNKYKIITTMKPYTRE